MQFADFSDCIHVDEKWFYVNKTKKIFYLSTDEEDSHLTIPNKNHMTTVMFLVARRRPKYDCDGKRHFRR